MWAQHIFYFKSHNFHFIFKNKTAKIRKRKERFSLRFEICSSHSSERVEKHVIFYCNTRSYTLFLMNCTSNSIMYPIIDSSVQRQRTRSSSTYAEIGQLQQQGCWQQAAVSSSSWSLRYWVTTCLIALSLSAKTAFLIPSPLADDSHTQ